MAQWYRTSYARHLGSTGRAVSPGELVGCDPVLQAGEYFGGQLRPLAAPFKVAFAIGRRDGHLESRPRASRWKLLFCERCLGSLLQRPRQDCGEGGGCGRWVHSMLGDRRHCVDDGLYTLLRASLVGKHKRGEDRCGEGELFGYGTQRCKDHGSLLSIEQPFSVLDESGVLEKGGRNILVEVALRLERDRLYGLRPPRMARRLLAMCTPLWSVTHQRVVLSLGVFVQQLASGRPRKLPEHTIILHSPRNTSAGGGELVPVWDVDAETGINDAWVVSVDGLRKYDAAKPTQRTNEQTISRGGGEASSVWGIRLAPNERMLGAPVIYDYQVPSSGVPKHGLETQSVEEPAIDVVAVRISFVGRCARCLQVFVEGAICRR
jgi:hypothetical protein